MNEEIECIGIHGTRHAPHDGIDSRLPTRHSAEYWLRGVVPWEIELKSQKPIFSNMTFESSYIVMQASPLIL